MLLAVDIGNTSTKFGIFKGEQLLTRFSIPTSADELLISDQIGSRLGDSLSSAIVCSVVPEASAALIELLSHRQVKTILVSNELNFGLTVDYEPPSSLGADRLVNAVAAVEKYGSPVIVCSFGTATTIDVVSKDRNFLGGIIAPGLKTAAGSLRSNTSLLQEISIEKPNVLIGTSTESAILSGIVFGHVAMVEGLIQKMADQIGEKPRVIATGGFGSLMAAMTEIIDEYDADLTLLGLRLLSKRMR